MSKLVFASLIALCSLHAFEEPVTSINIVATDFEQEAAEAAKKYLTSQTIVRIMYYLEIGVTITYQHYHVTYYVRI